jgi:putative ABC transport system permease protein
MILPDCRDQPSNMFKNYCKTAWRNLYHNKFYSLINITGLAVGLAVGILILLWVQDELSFDSFHRNAKNLYRVELFGGTGASKQIWQTPVAAMGPLAKQEIPEVQDEVRLTWTEFSLIKYGQKVFGDEQIKFTDPSLFSIFDFPLIMGNKTRPFPNDNSIVITERTARKYFGDADPLGKVIVADGKESFAVSGVIADIPLNSSISGDIFMPMSHHIKTMLIDNKVDLNTDFNSYSYETYVKLRPGTSLKKLAADLYNVHIKRKPEDTDADYLLLPVTKMHLYNADLSDRGIGTVRMFVLIALVILLIACINYVNLSTARSMLRAREISMRKIIGAARVQLFLQFVVETGLLFLISVGVALAIIGLLMPAFNQLSGKHLVFNPLDPSFWKVIGITIVATLALSSIYPALLLSSFEPLKALKGKITSGIGNALFRKILVILQFTCSVVLIVSTLVITRQLSFIRSKDLGYDKSHVFGFWMRDAGTHFESIKAELLKQPGIEAVTRATGNIIRNGMISGDNSWDGKAPGQTFIVHPMGIDKYFIPFFKMQMKEGTAFTGSQADSTHFILNETAVREIGLKDPVGKRFKLRNTEGTIIGIVKDFHFNTLREKIAPAVFFYTTPSTYQTMYVKTNGQYASKALVAAGVQFKQYNGEYPFTFHFLDDLFKNLYQGEEREGVLFNYFAGMAIFISCLGLLGLAAYTAQVRTREIGVRKTLGASVSAIIGLLTKDFVQLVVIAIVVAFPLAWFSMHSWLRGFAYRIDLDWAVFGEAALIAVVIAFATISFQSVKAALRNAVESLRSE